MSTTERHNFRYTAFFCEENIWWLCHSLITEGIGPEQLSVVFISNPNQQVAVFNQLNCAPDRAMTWDYHVVLLRKIEDHSLIYDFDSRCEFPVDLNTYLSLSFADQELIKPEYRAQFRLIDAKSFLERFSSDRSHMIGEIETSRFPDYQPIVSQSSDTAISLQQYFDFTKPLSKNETLYSVNDLRLACC